MSSGRQLCLKWNDFQENVSKSFSGLRNCPDFQDVTLVSDDHQKLSAHRIILSTCSEYFREVLRGNEETKPLLCLENVTFQDLENILDYIYHGETQVEQRYVQRFLKLAQRFKLEGLQDTTLDNDSKDFLQSANIANGSKKSQMKTSETEHRFPDMQIEYTRSIHSKFHGELFRPHGSRGPKASMTWKFGGLKKDSDGNLIADNIFCALCPKTMTYKYSTNILLDHLKWKHLDVYLQNLKLIEQKEELSENTKEMQSYNIENDLNQSQTKASKTKQRSNKIPIDYPISPSVHSDIHGELFRPIGSLAKGAKASKAWNYGGLKKDSDGNFLFDKMYCALCMWEIGYRDSPSALNHHLNGVHMEVIYKEQEQTENIKAIDMDITYQPKEEEPSVSNSIFFGCGSIPRFFISKNVPGP